MLVVCGAVIVGVLILDETFFEVWSSIRMMRIQWQTTDLWIMHPISVCSDVLVLQCLH